MKRFKTFLILVIISGSILAQEQPRIYINEFLASNVSIDADMADFDDYSDWIELYNDEDAEVGIGGYYLTDDPDQPLRWRIPDGTKIPAKGFLRFWADGYDEKPGQTFWRPWPNYLDMSQPRIYFLTQYYHLNFGLSRAGEFIGLFDPDGNVIDSLSYDLQYRDVSMGRQPDGGPEWFFFGEPTPQASNQTEGVTTVTFTESPVVTPESGFYEQAQRVEMTSGSAEKIIKFTADGSRPGSNTYTYDESFDISWTTVLRARSFESGGLPGDIVNRSYFLSEDFSLPVISIITPPKYLWDHRLGIYENRLKNREIPIGFQYFSSDGETLLDINAGLRLTGQISLYCPQVSFTITARDRYGSDEISCRFFQQRELDAFKSLYLRNSGVPDNWNTHFRDAMAQSLVINKMDVDCQSFQPAVLFLNGEYWGLYNIREKIGSDYLAALHNLNPDDIDLLEYASGDNVIEVMEGNDENYKAFDAYYKNHDLSLEEDYRFIESWMDIDEYINYQICEIYFDNIIWPNINVRMWRERKEDAKWRWVLFDTDFGFGMPNPGSTGYTNNTMAYATSSGSFPQPAPEWSTLLFRKLLMNDEFKAKFIRRFEGYLNTVFHADTVLSVINNLETILGAEMNRHINRWKNETFEFGTPIPSMSEWYSNVRVMKDFARYRPYYQRQHLIGYFKLQGSSVLEMKIQDPGAGKVLINEVVSVNSSTTGIYFKGVPVSLRAVPEVGHRFVGWEGIPGDSISEISFIPDTDTVRFSAIFDTISVNTVPEELLADEILTGEKSPYYATGDIIVPPHRTLTIEYGVELLMPEKACIVVNGRLIVNGTMEEPAIIKPNEYAGSWGAICFVNATDSSTISNLTVYGSTKGRDFARDRAGISGFHSNFSLENVNIEDADMPLFVQFGNISVKGCRFRADRSGDLINIKNAGYAIVEDCDLRGSDHFDSDAIDYDRISGGIIRGNRIYNFYGFNSDAIDLGEDCHEILIEGNRIYNIDDKGVSIGSGSTGIIKRNLFANCGQGVGIKDFGSYGYIEHNTFYANGYGVACFVKNIGAGGGSADIVNSILVDSRIYSAWADDQSTINISYSMINTDRPEGSHNIYDYEPVGFYNNLYLDEESPAVNRGDPSLPPDLDGSLPDIGAYPYDEEKEMGLHIDEIHYHPPQAEGDGYQFVELVNNGNYPVQIGGFKLTGSISLTFSEETIAPGEIFLVAGNKGTYNGQGYKVFEWETGNLNEGPGELLLLDGRGELVDFVDYNKRDWWPREPDGQGPSLELHYPGLENMVTFNWRSSYADGGTPGKSSNSVPVSGIYINEFMASNNSVYADEYGDFDDWIELYNSTDKPVNIAGLYITDDLDVPYREMIPLYDRSATTIPAKGFLLLWADGEPEEGVLHLGFKLNQVGEELGLVQFYDGGTRFIDSLSFGAQLLDRSAGRYPDGADLHKLSEPTPLASNLYTGIRPVMDPSHGFTLLQNYPNPFRYETAIGYWLMAGGQVELSVYNIMGRKVTTLVSEVQPAGDHIVYWSANGLEPGIYICELRTVSGRQLMRMILNQ